MRKIGIILSCRNCGNYTTLACEYCCTINTKETLCPACGGNDVIVDIYMVIYEPVLPNKEAYLEK